MQKIVSVMAALAILGCNLEPDGEIGSSTLQTVDEISDEVTSGQFENIEELQLFLDNTDVSYSVNLEENLDLIVPPSSCELNGSNFELYYLRFEGILGPKVYRYRVYLSPSNPLCIEEDFAFANPYQ